VPTSLCSSLLDPLQLIRIQTLRAFQHGAPSSGRRWFLQRLKTQPAKEDALKLRNADFQVSL
jgi:hypothetical protein